MNVRDLRHVLKERNQFEQLGIGPVVKPRAAGDCIVRLKYIRCWRVVYNNRLVKRSAKTAQVLDVRASVKHAVLPEQPEATHSLWIEQVGDWVGIFGQRCCEEHHFIQLPDGGQKLVNVRPFEHVDPMLLPVDLNRNNVVRVRHLNGPQESRWREGRGGEGEDIRELAARRNVHEQAQ